MLVACSTETPALQYQERYQHWRWPAVKQYCLACPVAEAGLQQVQASTPAQCWLC